MKRLVFLLAFLFVGMQLWAQRTITGTVTSKTDGSPLAGVSVVVKGTTIGTITDVNGKYTLEVPEDAKTLVFSFVGYKTVEVPITGDVINVEMEEEAVGLEEVVVTALGVTREKKALDYAVQEVSGEEISTVKTTNFLTSLSGKIAGVQITQSSGAVGASANIVIRGNRSFGNNMPLFVVDGTPINNATSGGSQWGGVDFGNALMDLNPDDIESITVLKGANATALYGSRGANGVILITTKKAKKKGIGVRINSGVTFDNVYILPYYQNKYGQGYFGSEYYYHGGFSDWLYANYGVRWEDIYGQPIDEMMDYQEYATGGGFGYTGFSYYDGNWGGVMDGMDESWGPRLDIGLEIPQFDSPVIYDENGNFVGYEPTPWVSQPNNVIDFFETGVTFDNTLELTGGTDKAGARLSIANQTVKGAIPNTDLTKNSVFFNGRLDLGKRLHAQANITYINNHSNNLPGGGYDENNVMQSIGSWFGRQVNMASLRAHWNELDPLGYPYNWNHSYHNNPYYTVYVNTTSRTRNRVFGNVSLTYDIFDWLNFMVRVGNDFYSEFRKHVWGSLSQEAGISNGPENTTGGGFWQSMRTFDELNIDAFFNFDKSFGDIRLTGLLGGNFMHQEYHYTGIQANELTVPDFFTISNVSGNPQAYQYDSKRETNSLFLNTDISYKSWLFLSFSVRNDWSSTLPPDNWSYLYYSVGGSLIFTDMLNLKSKLLSYGKLRLSYAQVGNDTGPYMLYGTFSADQPFNGVTGFSYTNTLPPTNLKPEITSSVEGGLEMRFLNNRLGFDITLYDMKSRNQILSVDIAPSSGFTAMTINAGEIENKGIELVLDGTPVKTKNFSWDIAINWARNINQVNELYGTLESYVLLSSWKGTVVEARPGKTYGVLRGPGIMRDPDGRILVNPATGLPQSSPDLVELGYVVPDWIGGIRNTFNYKGLSFSFLIDMRMGGDIFSVTDWFGAYAGILWYTAEGDIRENGLVVGKDVWQDEVVVYGTLDQDGNPIYMDAEGNVVESPVTNETVVSAQDFFEGYWFYGAEPSIIHGTYIKLREVALTYNVPKKLVNKLGFVNDIRLSFIGRNIALLYTDPSNRAHIDPEVAYGTSIGVEQYQIPPTRSLGFKISIGF